MLISTCKLVLCKNQKYTIKGCSQSSNVLNFRQNHLISGHMSKACLLSGICQSSRKTIVYSFTQDAEGFPKIRNIIFFQSAKLLMLLHVNVF